VEKLEKTAAGFNNHGLVYPLDVVELLRRQHAAYVRMVLVARLRARKAAVASVLARKTPDWQDAKIEVLNDLLTALARYKR
jgi:hypothetical protein